LRSSFIARFGDAPFLPQAARTTADRPTASIEDLMTVRTCASIARAALDLPVGVVAGRASRALP
jgi:hypothetical protein